MRLTTTLCACLLLVSCGSSRIAPLEFDPVSLAIERALQTINTGIVREDEILASQQVHSRFVMGSNISLRYRDETWGEGRGQGDFRKFFKDVFEIHANIYHSLVLIDLELTGDLASARVEVVFNSTRSDKIPPEGFAAEGLDLFIFEREGGSWQLIAWDETPDPPAHDEGILEDI